MAKKSRKKADLGKGVEALLSGINMDLGASTESEVAMISIDSIEANPWQPRKEFDKEDLDELTESIKIHGLIQPITVRKLINSSAPYQLISGERRLRASKIAGLEEIPAYIRSATNQEMLEMALVENIQRADLNPLEIANTYIRLRVECNFDETEIAKRVGKKESTIRNYTRLLELPKDIQKALHKKEISLGHAKAIAGLKIEKDQIDMLKKIKEHSLSVRAAEELAKFYQNPKRKIGGKKQDVPAAFSEAYRKIEDDLRNLLEAKVQLKRKSNGKGGQIVIPFVNDNDLNRILEFIEKDGF